LLEAQSLTPNIYVPPWARVPRRPSAQTTPVFLAILRGFRSCFVAGLYRRGRRLVGYLQPPNRAQLYATTPVSVGAALEVCQCVAEAVASVLYGCGHATFHPYTAITAMTTGGFAVT